jgi:hypothetical protein
MLQHLQIIPIILGILTGYVVFFIIKPSNHEIVTKYPNPVNPGESTYRDKNGLCYVFSREEVKCSADIEIKSFPLN